MSTQLVCIASLVLAAGVVGGCGRDRGITGTIQTSPERGRRLLTLAAREAAAIKDVDVRLTRQLNLADQQLSRGWDAEAKQTLDEATKTLVSPDGGKLKDHARLSGWISISQLSRQADDRVAADKASQKAIAAMLSIEDPARRCEYVMGIANEVEHSRGAAEASKLLVQAGPWTPSIDDIQRRRQAVVSFASALFNLDNFDAGQRMLQHEEDAAWRSETLSQLALLATDGPVRYPPDAAALEVPVAGSARTPHPASSVPFFGRKLDYKTVFQNQVQSQTVADQPTTRPAMTRPVLVNPRPSMVRPK